MALFSYWKRQSSMNRLRDHEDHTLRLVPQNAQQVDLWCDDCDETVVENKYRAEAEGAQAQAPGEKRCERCGADESRVDFQVNSKWCDLCVQATAE